MIHSQLAWTFRPMTLTCWLNITPPTLSLPPLPGPSRRFELPLSTPMMGWIVGMIVGVSVGGSGVEVAVSVGVAVEASPVSVKYAKAVAKAEVATAFPSGVGVPAPAAEHPARINRAKIEKILRYVILRFYSREKINPLRCHLDRECVLNEAQRAAGTIGAQHEHIFLTPKDFHRQVVV